LAGPLNVPTVTQNDLSFGPGVVYVGPVGSTPSTHLGAVEAGSTLEIRSSVLDVRQGNPSALIKRFNQSQDVGYSCSGLEWDLYVISQALGCGVTSAAGKLDFGGDPNTAKIALLVQHQTPAGGTIDVRIWEAVGNGEVSLGFGEDSHKFPYRWDAVLADTDWAGGSLTDKNRYFQIEKQ